MNNTYINYLKGDKKSEKTISSYTRVIEKMLAFISKPETEIKPADIINYKGYISNLSSASVCLELSAIKSYFKFLRIIGEIKNDPTLDIDMPTKHNKIKHHMSAQMIRNMINATNSIKNKAIITFLASTGVRYIEFRNIGLKEYQEAIANGTKQIKILGKGNKERFIYINPDAEKAIDKYIKYKRHDGCDALFTSDMGNPMSEQSLNETLKLIAKKANIPFYKEISPHYLRVACATIMSDNKVPVANIRDILGHSSLSVTSRYIKTSEEDIKAVSTQCYF